jgi:gamma-glutamylcyclotransferase (GGCT)/AIG2-like uncharacterized protein YtfP
MVATMPLVFVYGTLMRAGANHAVLVRLGCTFVGNAVTREARTLVDLGPYPALLPLGARAPVALVHGEVWEIDDHALRELDAFEGCPELYMRERIALAMLAMNEDRRALEAFVYVLAQRPPARARVIGDGRYSAAGTLLPHGATPDQIASEQGDDDVVLDNGAGTEDVARPPSLKSRGPR